MKITPDTYTHNDLPIPDPRLLYLRVEHDEDPINPLTEYDGQWTLYDFRYRDGTPGLRDQFVDDYGNLTIGIRAKLRAGTAFTLHRWRDEWAINGHDSDVQGEPGLLVWEHPVKDMGAKSYADRMKDAGSCLNEYNAWATGDVWGYILEDANHANEDSCWGYYGDYIQEVIKTELLQPHMKRHNLTGLEFVSAKINRDLFWKHQTTLPDDRNPATLYVVVSGDGAYHFV